MPASTRVIRTVFAFLVLLAAPAFGAGLDLGPFRPHESKIVTAITLGGNRVTRDFVISREIETSVGKPLLAATLDADFHRLENLGIFSSIRIEPTAADSGVALNFHVTEMPAIIPYPALSYTEQNGWSVGVGMSSLNMLGRDIVASGRILVGGTTTGAVGFSYPWIAGNHLSVDATAAHLIRQDDLNGFEETSDEVAPWIGTYIGKRGRAQALISYFRMQSDVPGKTLSPDNVDHFIRTGVSLGYDSRNSLREPSAGVLAEGEVVKIGGRLGGDGDSWATTLDFRAYQTALASQTAVLSLLLSTQSGEVGVGVPQYLLYRLGGANTVRGYDLEVLGRELYGKNQLLGTVEYNFPIRRVREYSIIKWKFSLGLAATVFADQGIAWSEGSDLALQRAKFGGGAGLRLLVPGLEMFRFDLGFGQGGGAVFHFAAGTKMDAQRKRLR